MTKLKAWKDKGQRKPLLLRGARQTGKTWFLKEFGRSEFDSLAYVGLLASSRAREVFDGDFDMPRIVSALSVESGTKIEAGKTLVVLDEVQEAPRALTALKYFCQDAPDYHVAAAGLYLGIAKHEGVSFPVGKVNMLSLEPMSFMEFLDATGLGGGKPPIQEPEGGAGSFRAQAMRANLALRVPERGLACQPPALGDCIARSVCLGNRGH